jgi:hypothetical protein
MHKKSGKAIGLSGNESICELITEDDRASSMFRQTAPNIVIVRPQSACLLHRAPTGDSIIIDNALKTKLDNLQAADTIWHSVVTQCTRRILSIETPLQFAKAFVYAPCYQRQFLLHEYHYSNGRYTMYGMFNRLTQHGVR